MKVLLLEAVDPEERKLRLRKVLDYHKRNTGAMKMVSTADPHAKVHYYVRAAHASRILTNHSGKYSRKVARIVRGEAANRRDFRKAQATAKKKAKGPIVPHAAHKLTSTGGWIAYRRSIGLTP